MNRTRRIIALLLIILSVTFFTISVVGLGLVWGYNQPLTNRALDKLNGIESDLTSAQQGIQQARTELDSAQAQIDLLQSALDTLGLQGAEDIQKVSDLVSKLESTLLPVVDGVKSGVEGLRDALVKIKTTIESLNNLPLVNINIPGVETLEAGVTELENLQNQIQEGRDRITNISEVTQNTITSLTTGFSELETSLQDLNSQLTVYETKVSDYLTQVNAIQSNLANWIDWASVILTVLLVWLAFSQAALFVLAWSFYKQEDLLRGWR